MDITDEDVARARRRLVEDVIISLVRGATVRALREIEAEARRDPGRAPELAPTIAWLRVGLEELAASG